MEENPTNPPMNPEGNQEPQNTPVVEQEAHREPPQSTQVPPQPKPQEEAQKALQEAIPEEWQNYTTGSAVLDTSIASLLQTMGSNPEEFLKFTQNAIDYGDVNLIDTTAIQSKYPQYYNAIKAMTQAVIAQNQQNATSVQNTAYGVAGSKQKWDQAVQIFNANAPKYLRETVKTMINNGYVQEGANMLMSTVQNLGSLPSTTPAYNGTANTSRGITFDEMKAELAKLTKEAGGASLESGTYGRRYKDIMERRRIGHMQGI